MKIREPIPHWNNFTVPELKNIMKHCVALERLGIAQDEEMMNSIERDIALREGKMRVQHAGRKLKPIRTIQRLSDANSSAKKASPNAKQQPQELLLEQTA